MRMMLSVSDRLENGLRVHVFPLKSARNEKKFNFPCVDPDEADHNNCLLST